MVRINAPGMPVRIIALSFVVAFVLPGAKSYASPVTVVVHEARSISNADGGGTDDIYAKIRINDESRSEALCDFKDVHRNDVVLVRDDWTCSAYFAPEVEDVLITIELWEHDDGLFDSDDDHFDISPVIGRDLSMTLDLATQNLVSTDIPGFEAPQCARGKIRVRGDEGADFAEIVFSVTSSISPFGDADGDGLLDSWEICGTTGVDLPALGADPNHRDIYLELDWMQASDHAHTPWLTSLINLWSEFNAMVPLANPDGTDGARLHIDVGDLYRGYRMNLDTDAAIEIDVNDREQGGRDMNGDGVNESLDLDNDGIVDIGHLGAIERTLLGGEAIAEVPTIDVTGVSGRFLSDDSVEFDSLGPDYASVRSFASTRLGVFRYGMMVHEGLFDGCAFRGIAECNSKRGCDEFMIALGTRSDFQLVLDAATGDPVPDGAPLNGPTGQPVYGTFDEHTVVIMHELGHTIGLRHGGIDDINRKSNLISVMNYIYSSTLGIPIASQDAPEASRLAQDWNRDRFPDTGRFIYSPTRLRPLDEQRLDETSPLYGSIGPLRTLDRVSMTSFGPPLTTEAGDDELLFVRVDGKSDACRGIDFSRDGICDDEVAVDINDFNTPATCGRITFPAPIPNQQLAPVSELHDLGLRGIGIATSNAVLTGISYDERDAIRSALRRVRTVDNEVELADQCTDTLRNANFDELPAGPISTDQYGDWLLISSNPGGEPTVIPRGERDDMPTWSEEMSLLTKRLPGANDIPTLVLDFSRPVRRAALYAGYSDRHSAGVPQVRLTAYDVYDRKMGAARKTLAPPAAGVSTFIGLSSMLAGDPIARVVVEYENVEPDQLVHIDDVTACAQTNTIEPPAPVVPPDPGDRRVPTTVRAELLVDDVTTSDEPGHFLSERYELFDVPITTDGDSQLTRHVEHTRAGHELTISAPSTLSSSLPSMHFRDWRLSNRNGQSARQPMDETEATWRTDLAVEAVATYTIPEGLCTIRVNSKEDVVDIKPGDGVCLSKNKNCTLRAAIQEANASDDYCLILLPEAYYSLSIAGRGEDESVTGDLDITRPIAIFGAGPGRTVIDGSKLADTVIHITEDAQATISGVTIQGGEGRGYPGGISNDGELRLFQCAVVGNRSTGNAGGIWNNGDLFVNQCLIADNIAELNGGGIYTRRGSTRVVASAVTNNRTNKFDGAGLANNGGSLSLDRSSITGNHANRQGGGIWSDRDLSLKNVTVSSNEASSAAGIYVIGGTADLSAVTIAKNTSASDAGAGLANRGATVKLANGLIAGNRGKDGTRQDCTGRIESLGYNLIENPIDCDLRGELDTLILNQDPRLLSLAADPSAPTSSHELSASSPAVDAGGPAAPSDDDASCPREDQSFTARPTGARCDIGAREYRAY